MFGHFYNSSLRRYIVLMGDLFSRMQVSRQGANGKQRYIRVPITYASKELFTKKLEKITSINSQENIAKVETILPRVSLNMIDMVYNGQFKTAISNRSLGHAVKHDPSKLVSQYNPAPYKLMFELSIHTRHEDDMFQIIEQILPYFQPHFVTTVHELHENQIEVKHDIKITFQSLAMDNITDGNTGERRRLEWTLIFELDGWMYPPIKEVEGEIRTIYLDFFNNASEMGAQGSFESVDLEIDPRTASEAEWEEANKPVIQTLSKDIPIPVAPLPPGPRGE